MAPQTKLSERARSAQSQVARSTEFTRMHFECQISHFRLEFGPRSGGGGGGRESIGGCERGSLVKSAPPSCAASSRPSPRLFAARAQPVSALHLPPAAPARPPQFGVSGKMSGGMGA